jgi:hypothetical protein
MNAASNNGCPQFKRQGVDVNTRRAQIQSMMLAICIITATLAGTGRETGAQQQTGDLMTEMAILHVQICRAFGGTAGVEDDRTVGGGLSLISVQCLGGMLSGFHCLHRPSGSACQWQRVQKEDSGVTPIADLPLSPGNTPIPTATPTATAVPTEVPLPPTTIPTDIPAPPTTIPTQPPQEPTPIPTKDDTLMPPDLVEDPDKHNPAPTSVPVR